MKKILVASTNEFVLKAVKKMCQKYFDYFDPIFCLDTDEAISFIDYELPEVKVLDFSSADIDCKAVLGTIDSDPWFHNGGVVAVTADMKQLLEIEELKNQNILIVQTVNMFITGLEQLFKVLWSNQHILFNRGIQENIAGIESGSFVCDNSLLNTRLYTAFLVNYLYCSNRIDAEGRSSLQTVLVELFTNAIEHGNCNISYDEKSEWLENGGTVVDLIEQKSELPENKKKKVYIDYKISKDSSFFKIRDEGNGFDWKKQVDRFAPDATETHGRGIILSKGLTRNFRYNERGNEVSFEIPNINNRSNTIPKIMVSLIPIEYKKGDVIFNQNDVSSDLFFIVSGCYKVYADGNLISELTPNDIFIGEMAFLLDDRRSASVVASEDGRLIRIPKVTFLNLIRKNPHYGIFLSKLLAQRLVNQHKLFSSVKAHADDLAARLAEIK